MRLRGVLFQGETRFLGPMESFGVTVLYGPSGDGKTRAFLFPVSRISARATLRERSLDFCFGPTKVALPHVIGGTG